MTEKEDSRETEALRRFQMISPLLDESLDLGKALALRRRIAAEQHLSPRTLYRYEKAFREDGFDGLKPAKRVLRAVPQDYQELLQECIQLKREVPLRSVNQIILILEMEGRAAPGVLKRSTVQRHLERAGFGRAQMKKHLQASRSSSRRYWKPHRMMLVQADIKYGPKLPIGKHGRMTQTYLVVILDDHSRYVIGSGFYDNMNGQIVEDTYRRAILTYGKMDRCYHDNGGQFISQNLTRSFAKLGIKMTRCKPYSPASKGAVEVFNRFVNAFLAEAKAQKIRTLQELNHYWEVWLDAYYHKKPHEGLAAYYKDLGLAVPDGGITPEQEWNRDARPLTFLDTAVVTQAFLHHEKRRVDNSGCIQFQGRAYEVGPSLAGQTVAISYDPMQSEILTVHPKDMLPFDASPRVLTEFCGPKPEIPDTLLPAEPESSRFLTALEAKRKENLQLRADGISFGSYRKEGEQHV